MDRCEEGGLEFASHRLLPKPDHYVSRDEDVNKILDLLKQDQAVGIVGIKGLGGIGKTVLAQAVSEQMTKNLRVVWLTLGEQPVVVKLFHQIHTDFTGTQGSFDDIANAKDWLKKFSETEIFMLVLDDVWSLDHASPFKIISPPCKVLITTRDVRILQHLHARPYDLNTLDKSQSKALFLKCAGVTTDSLGQKEGEVVDNIVNLLGNMPLAITIVGHLVNGRLRLNYLKSILKDIESGKIFWESEFSPDDYKYASLFGAFDVSFQALSVGSKPSSRPDELNSVQKLFLKFGLFKDDIDVPYKVLLELWKYDINSEKDDFEKSLYELEEKSFISVSNEERSFYRLHDLVLKYARYKIQKLQKIDGLESAHRKLLKMYSQKCGGLWWKLDDDGYIYDFLYYHLYEANESGQLNCLLFEIEWLTRKLSVTNMYSLMNDFRYAEMPPRKLPTVSDFKTDSDVQLLKRALQLASHRLSSEKHLLVSELSGRLIGLCSNRIQDFLKSFNPVESEVLIALTPCLSSPDDKRLQTFNRTGEVKCVALSHDTKFLYTGGDQLRCIDVDTREADIMEDKCYVTAMALDEESGYVVTGDRSGDICMWPLRNSSQVFKRLVGHTWMVTSVISIPGRKAVASLSLDRTFRVWDVNTCTSTFTCTLPSNIDIDNYGLDIAENKSLIIFPKNYLALLCLMTYDFEKNQLKAVTLSNEYDRAAINGKAYLTSTDRERGEFRTFDNRVLGTISDMNYIKQFWMCSDMRHVVYSTHGANVRVFDIQHEKTVQVIDVSYVEDLCVSDDDQVIVTPEHYGREVTMWKSGINANNDAPPVKLNPHDGRVTSLCVTRDARHVISAGGHSLCVWRWPDMQLHTTLKHDHEVTHVITSPPSNNRERSVAISGDRRGSIYMWDLTEPISDTPLHVYSDCNYPVRTLSRDDSGVYMYACSSYHDDTSIRIYDLRIQSVVMSLKFNRLDTLCELSMTKLELFNPFIGRVEFRQALPFLRRLCKPNKTNLGDKEHQLMNWIRTCMLSGARVIRLDSNYSDLAHTSPLIDNDARYSYAAKHNTIVRFDGKSESCEYLETSPLTDSVGNTGSIKAFKVSPSQKRCVGTIDDIDVWCLSGDSDIFSSNNSAFRLAGHCNGAIDIYENESKCLVAVGYTNGSVGLWDLDEKTQLHTLTVQAKIEIAPAFVKFAQSGAKVFAGINDVVVIWDVASRELENEFELETEGRRITQRAVSPDETLFAYVTETEKYGIKTDSVYTCSLSTGECRLRHDVSLLHAHDVHFKDNNTLIILGKEMRPIRLCQTAGCCSPQLVYIMDGKDLWLYKDHTSPALCVFDASTGWRITSTCMLECGYIVTGNSDVLRVWDVHNTQSSHVKPIDIDENDSRLVTSFHFESLVSAVHEITPNNLAVGLHNGQVHALRLTCPKHRRDSS